MDAEAHFPQREQSGGRARPARWALFWTALFAASFFALGPSPPLAQERASATTSEPVMLYEPLPRPPGHDLYWFEKAETATASPNSAADAVFADLFVRLHFDLERGAPRQSSSFWPAPVFVQPDSAMAVYWPFLDRYLATLRSKSKAPVTLTRTPPVGAAVLHVRAGAAIGMRRRLGPAVCVAFPGDWQWADLADALDRDEPPSWRAPGQIRSATVFVPDRAPPWLARACIMEEIAQAFGPAGDFFWLTGSIFNDDNVRLAPSAFDLLMVRLAFAPELRTGLSRKAARAAAMKALDRIRREDPSAIPPAPGVFADNHDWRSRLRLARSIRHPTFSEVYYREAAEASQRLREEDPRRLWTRLEAARERARSTPSRAEARLDAISAAFAQRDGPGGLYQAMADLERAHIRLTFGRFTQARALLEPARDVFLQADREDLVVEAEMALVASREGLRRALDVRTLPAEAEAWRAFAYGAPVQAFNRAPEPRPARPPQGYAPILFASLLTVLPLLAVSWLLRRVF